MFRRRGLKKLEKISLVRHDGIFKTKINTFAGVALIVSGTIGAGILSIPYAVAKVGWTIGFIYIVAIGILMIGFNLLLGEIAVRTRGNLQLVGLADKYLGKVGGWIMALLIYTSVAGVMVVYIIGEGESLAALFGGSSFQWSLIFFTISSILIYYGLSTIKIVDFFLSLAVLAVILIIAAFSVPHARISNLGYHSLADVLFPYGVLLFAYRGGGVILEAHSILSGRDKAFKKVILVSGIIIMFAYLLFTISVLGVTGQNTTEIATIGLGKAIGPVMLVFGNVFAVLAMASCFLLVGLSTKDSLCWDKKIKDGWATLIVCGLPLVIFLLGLRQFIVAIDIVGGVLVSLEIFMLILVYWRAKQKGDLQPVKYNLHHTWLLIALLLLALTVGTIYSITKHF